MLTIQKILEADWSPDDINENDYHVIWTVLRLEIDRIQNSKPRKDEWDLMRNYQKLMNSLLEVHDQHTKLKCDRCGKNASWNTPVTDGAGVVLCPTCCEKDDTDTLWYGIHQRSEWGGDMPLNQNPQHLSYYYRSVVLHADQRYHVERNAPGQVTRLMSPEDRKDRRGSEDYYSNPRFQFNLPMFHYTCWIRGGQQSIHLTDVEQRMPPEELILHIYQTFVLGNMYRCTTCDKDFPNPPADYPLFAGAVCSDCKKLHLQKLDEQRRKGQVCSMCHQPYGNCSC